MSDNIDVALLAHQQDRILAELGTIRDDQRVMMAIIQRLDGDMAKLYRAALRRMPETNDGQPPLPVRIECPTSLEEFLTEEP